MARRVAVVAHTHWDREWYEPFQTFRLRLVDLLDDVLPRLEADPSLVHFHLDGQLAMVDDYLAVRPESRERLRHLAEAGRVAVGPWYALPDEFCVSGETLVRNLQRGWDGAAALGGALEVGYLPDMFGHVGQMPQLLALMGFEHAVVWRGVPAAVDRDAFWWEAPDGSAVRAEYLPGGYSNGAFLPVDPVQLLDRIAAFEDEHAALVTEPVLWMHGTDHQVPATWLGDVVAAANDLDAGYHVEVVTLAEYLAGATTDDLPRWSGELRSGARANLLMGVASNRVDVKQAAARAERALERRAEPLSALFLPAYEWPAALLGEAWLGVVRNSAHDSSCACSIDEVVDAVLVRYAEAERIADGLAERALGRLSADLASAGPVAVNPSAHARSGLVELTRRGAGTVAGEQVLAEDPGRFGFELPLGEAVHLLDAMLGNLPGFVDARVEEAADGAVEVVLHREPTEPSRVVPGRVVAAVRAAGGGDDTRVLRVAVDQPASRRVLARVVDVPGFGWRAVEETPVPPPVTAEHGALDNGRIRVEVDALDGTFSVDGHAGLGQLVDGGDRGDTYNWCPPTLDRLVDAPDTVVVTVAEPGPLRAALLVEARYRWPERIRRDARVGEREVVVRTRLELRAGEDLVRVTVELDNAVRDHRLRAWFPLPEPTSASRAECAFGVVERGLTAEGGPNEPALATFPSRRFVSAGGLTVVHEGLLEYELIHVADGRAGVLALTLLRSVGMLSQGPMPTRPLPAGPMIPVAGAQLAGARRFRYAVHVGDADPYRLVEDAFLPLEVVEAVGGGAAHPSGSALTVRGAEVSAVVRDAGALVVRVFNPHASPTRVEIPGRQGWLVDLRGHPLEPVAEGFELRPHGIATLRLVEHGTS